MGEDEDTDEDEDDEVDEHTELMNKLKGAGLDPNGKKVAPAEVTVGGENDWMNYEYVLSKNLY